MQTLGTQEGNRITADEFLRSHSQIQLPGDREPVPIPEHLILQQDHVHNGICAALLVRDHLCAHGARNRSRAATRRLVGAVLAEQHDEWAEGRRYPTFTDNLATETLPSSNILEAAA